MRIVICPNGLKNADNEKKKFIKNQTGKWPKNKIIIRTNHLASAKNYWFLKKKRVSGE